MANYGHNIRAARNAGRDYRHANRTETRPDWQMARAELLPLLKREPTNKEMQVFVWFASGLDYYASERWAWEQ